MLTMKTCLLLGAGASAHLGFPLGADLKYQILGELNSQRKKPKDQLPEDFRKGAEDLNEFFEHLAFDDWSSPDAFLEKHPEVMTTGKYLITRSLSQCESEWGVASNRGWYNRLISAIGVDHVDKLKRNQLSIVSFNYDRSLDFRLHKYVERRFKLTPDDAWQTLNDAIPLIHLHGILGEYPKWPFGHQADFHERAQSIKIVSEIGDNLPAFQQASKLLNDADRVIVIGFGFAPDNVRRLNFFKEQSLEDRTVIVAAGPSGGSEYQKKVDATLQRWGLKPGVHYHMYDTNLFFDYGLNPFI